MLLLLSRFRRVKTLGDCSLPGRAIEGIFQARVLEWAAIAFSGEDGENSVNQEQSPHSALLAP